MKVTKRVRGLFLVGWLAATVAGCDASDTGAAASREGCVALRDHVAALHVGSTPVVGETPEVAGELDKHRRNLRGSLGDQFVDDCMAARSEGYLDCALAATTTSTLMACEGEQ